MIAQADPRTIVAPGHSRGADGTLAIGGVDVTTLAATYGTPLLAFDAATFDRTLDAFLAAATPHRIAVAYAGKALLLTGIARRLAAREHVELDVCSLGELATAERGGFPAARMTLHGCGKSDDELDAALAGRIGTIVVDGLFELERLIARSNGRNVAIGLRFNAGIEAHTHEFIRTNGENTKFGIAPRELDAALELLRGAPNVRLRALHSHIGSQIFDEAPYAANLEALLELAARASRAGFTVEKLILGGGFGVDENVAQQKPADPSALLSDLAGRTRAGAARAGIEPPALGIEPGRGLVAAAGTSLYSVVAIKDSGSRRFVVVDGGIADNPRPALYGAFHYPLVARSSATGPLRAATIAGRSCENDVMVETQLPEDLRPGDLLVLCTTGAYTYSMASNYNRFARPPVVETGSGSHRLLARRQTIEDVLRSDVAD